MNLRPARFRDKIWRTRRDPGARNDFGEFVPGRLRQVNFPATVQPMDLTDSDTAAGASLIGRLKVYAPQRSDDGNSPTLRAASDDAVADTVLYNGVQYIVEESVPWPTYVRATLLRET